MHADIAFRSVVLPAPAPPDRTMLRRPATAARSRSAVAGASVPSATRSSSCSARAGNLRMLSCGPSTASGGMIALTREPSGRRASTIGLRSSMRRPALRTRRWITCRRCCASRKRASVSMRRPLRSMNTRSGARTSTSAMPGSASSGSRGPSANASSSTPWISVSRSASDIRRSSCSTSECSNALHSAASWAWSSCSARAKSIRATSCAWSVTLRSAVPGSLAARSAAGLPARPTP